MQRKQNKVVIWKSGMAREISSGSQCVVVQHTGGPCTTIVLLYVASTFGSPSKQ